MFDIARTRVRHARPRFSRRYVNASIRRNAVTGHSTSIAARTDNALCTVAHSARKNGYVRFARSMPDNLQGSTWVTQQGRYISATRRIGESLP
jgi:hypothetical protein